YRHALETDIEPFKGLLMGLFFIAIGMTIDFSIILQRPLYVFSIVLAYTLIKAIMLYASAHLIGVAALQRSLFTALLAQGGEFAFVVFTSAAQAQVLNSKLLALLNLVVALSMAITPVLVLLIEFIQAKRLGARKPVSDQIDQQDAPIIIAGFGRLGQVVGRFLFANGLRATVLDHDPEQIELLRKFGFQVFYGDATRLDLLHAAGIEQSKILINAIDDQNDNLKLVDLVKQHFPHVKVVARARNVGHLLELRRRNVEIIERETFEASLRMGRSVLELMGVDRFLAREMADRFRKVNIQSLEEMMVHFHDEARRMSIAKAAREELKELIQRDMEHLDKHRQSNW
ncbi:MAG TPA: NAD-binding protein, partial [Pseudomonadales bacterium]|nr:NAD-binding protein [Pseudomonadales bacterium]